MCALGGENVPLQVNLFAVEGECLSPKANLCHVRQICTAGGGYEPWKAYLCHKRLIRAI